MLEREPAQEGDVGGALEPLVGEAASQGAEYAEEWTALGDVVAGDRQASETDYSIEDPRLEEVVRLVRATLPNASVQAIREYLQMLDDRRETQRKLALRSVAERLPDPKPATLGQRLGPASSTLAEAIVEALRHER